MASNLWFTLALDYQIRKIIHGSWFRIFHLSHAKQPRTQNKENLENKFEKWKVDTKSSVICQRKTPSFQIAKKQKYKISFYMVSLTVNSLNRDQFEYIYNINSLLSASTDANFKTLSICSSFLKCLLKRYTIKGFLCLVKDR